MVSCWQAGAPMQSAARAGSDSRAPQSKCSSDTFAHHRRSHVSPGKAAHWAYKERPAGAPPPPPAPAGDLAAASTSSSDEGEGLEHLGVEAGHPLLHIKGAAGDAVAMWLACAVVQPRQLGALGRCSRPPAVSHHRQRRPLLRRVQRQAGARLLHDGHLCGRIGRSHSQSHALVSCQPH